MGILTITTIQPDGSFKTNTIDTEKEKKKPHVSKSKSKKERKSAPELSKETPSD